MFYLQEDVPYKELTLSETEINNRFANSPTNGETTTGIEEKGLKTYASIIGQARQQIEIVSVEKSGNVGIDVLYRITTSTDSSSKHSVRVVSFFNPFGKPVGFKELN